jgi:dolichol-phosphate mannosyltransferase
MHDHSDKSRLFLSIVIPARNEAGNLTVTLNKLSGVLDKAGIPFEAVIVDDYSKDNTIEVSTYLAGQDNRVRLVRNIYARGYGGAVRCGLEVFKGAAVVIFMADLSDDPEDIIKYYKKIIQGYECVFGTRFCNQSRVINYPWPKLILNRLGNFFIQIFFWLPYNDITNAFKCYSRKSVEGVSPLISAHFDLTVEMPLKAVIRGYRWCVVPVNWQGRKTGISKWKIKEVRSKYIFTLLYLWLEKFWKAKYSLPRSVC